MKLKLTFVFIGICFVCGLAFSDERDSGEMSLYLAPIGIYTGSNKGYGALSLLGLTYEYYFFNWLSIDGGFNFKICMDEKFGFPGYLQIPVSVHSNIPKLTWLYAGIGFSFDIPLFCAMPPNVGPNGETCDDPPMSAFLSAHTDIGFDFNFLRLLFRVSKSLVPFSEYYYPKDFLFGVLLQIELMRINPKSKRAVTTQAPPSD